MGAGGVVLDKEMEGGMGRRVTHTTSGRRGGDKKRVVGGGGERKRE